MKITALKSSFLIDYLNSLSPVSGRRAALAFCIAVDAAIVLIILL